MKLISLLVSILTFQIAFADGYDIERMPDGPFQFKIYTVVMNEGSSLNKESILFNDASCPVKINNHSLTVGYEDRRFQLEGKTTVTIESPVVAMQIRTAMYDTFGQHMKNLSNVENRDFRVGEHSLAAQWRASDNDPSEHLTSVTYVARVRLEDGTQWVYNKDQLLAALGKLNLQQELFSKDDAE